MKDGPINVRRNVQTKRQTDELTRTDNKRRHLMENKRRSTRNKVKDAKFQSSKCSPHVRDRLDLTAN